MLCSPRGFVAAVLVITAAACAPVVPEDPNTIEITKVGSYSYMRQSRDLAIVVDVEMARKRTEEAYFPLGIKIANKRLGQVIVDRETLVLVDENGRIYPMPGVVELERNYDKLVPDHKFQSQTGIMGDTLLTGFSYYQKADSRFFPQVQGGGRVIDSVSRCPRGGSREGCSVSGWTSTSSKSRSRSSFPFSRAFGRIAAAGRTQSGRLSFSCSRRTSDPWAFRSPPTVPSVPRNPKQSG